VKDVEFLEKKVHKDFREFATWLTRNAQRRLSARFTGTGPKLLVSLTLDPSDLRAQGGLFTTRWVGTVALDVAFRAEQAVAKVAVTTQLPASGAFAGHLEPAGDRLLDDLESFIAATK